jgi:hypothetical protein
MYTVHMDRLTTINLMLLLYDHLKIKYFLKKIKNIKSKKERKWQIYVVIYKTHCYMKSLYKVNKKNEL